MRCLSRRDYSFQELHVVLRAKGFAAAIVQDVLEAYRERGLQSDARFAEMFIRSRAAKSCGPVRIEMEMRQRGVPDLLISQALAECGIDWFECLQALQIKKFGRKSIENAADRARQWRFLQHKGFPAEMIQQALQNQDLVDA